MLFAVACIRRGEPDADRQFFGAARHFDGPRHFVLRAGEQRAFLAAHAFELQLLALIVENLDIGRAFELLVAQVHDLALEHQAVALRGEERHGRHNHQCLLDDELGFVAAHEHSFVVRHDQHAESGQQVAGRILDGGQAALFGPDVRIEGNQLAEVGAALEFRRLSAILFRGLLGHAVRDFFPHRRFGHQHILNDDALRHPRHHPVHRYPVPLVQ